MKPLLPCLILLLTSSHGVHGNASDHHPDSSSSSREELKPFSTIHKEQHHPLKREDDERVNSFIKNISMETEIFNFKLLPSAATVQLADKESCRSDRPTSASATH
jgi:hypothetical protein